MSSGSGTAVSCGVGCRHSSDLVLLWLWCRPAVVAPIRPLAWEPPYAMGQPPPPKKKIQPTVLTTFINTLKTVPMLVLNQITLNNSLAKLTYKTTLHNVCEKDTVVQVVETNEEQENDIRIF